ncbi:hypothetical protein vseg_021712 [Gypsophila vaccaria]
MHGLQLITVLEVSWISLLVLLMIMSILCFRALPIFRMVHIHHLLWVTPKYYYQQPGRTQYYGNSPSYEFFDHLVGIDDYRRRDSEFPSTMATEQIRWRNYRSERVSNTTIHTGDRDCPMRPHNSHDYQATWQNNLDPERMSYEELLELGEAVGNHSRGLTHEQVSLLPVSKFRCCFLRRKSRSERCVICQMEYKRGARLITLPCKHNYHVGCGTKWLSINKACPICYTEVWVDAAKKLK